MSKIPKEYFLNTDVVALSKNLLGKILCSNVAGVITAGIITETEAYAGITDKASHAYNNRRTARTEIMFKEGGVAYIYLCYGIHHLFNIVTNKKEIPHAVLIRAIKPVQGIETILQRRNKLKLDKTISGGPGTVSQSLGITTILSGIPLTGKIIWLEDRGLTIKEKDIMAGPRIGVDYAKEDAMLPYRFRLI